MKSDQNVLTPAVLAERIQKKTGIDTEKIKQTTNDLFDIITNEINENGTFKLQGFGTFKKVFTAPSQRRNPQTNEQIEVPSHYKVKFTPASAAAERINKPFAHLKPKVLKEAVVPENKEQPVEPVNRLAELSVPDTEVEAGTLQQPAVVKETAEAQVPPEPENTVTTEHPVPQKTVPLPVVNQTIQNAVIEQQIIHQQIIHQQILNQTVPEKKQTEQPEDDFDPDYDTDEDDSEKYVNRCWFFAGTAVVLTAFVLVFFVLAVIHGTENSVMSKTAEITSIRKTQQPVQQISKQLRIAADDNLYAGLSRTQYGIPNLWPYIFSANMLRYPDPDRPGAAGKLIIPSKPDREIDRRDIEFSVIDVYDAYRTLIKKQPEGRTAELRREHAVIVLICGETLYTGFIRRYAARFDPRDVKAAEAQIQKAADR
ncbi:MAG: HU family DNA-binding protein [Treponema sp.]|nr:HU family DNA-binding protein [Treponema sp.]